MPYPLALQVQSFPPDSADESQEWFERHFFGPSFEKSSNWVYPPPPPCVGRFTTKEV